MQQYLKRFSSIANLTPAQTIENLNNTKSLLDSISHYYQSLSKSPIKPISSPPLPKTLPINPVPFDSILSTINKCIFPNELHWNHPKFYAFFPSPTSWPAIQANILSKSLASVGFTRTSSPISTDIEVVVSDWFAEMLKLPNQFFFSSGKGGGLTYGSASEACLTAMACATMKDLDTKKVVYASDQIHFSVIKAAKILRLPIRLIPSYYDPRYENYMISIEKLKKQIVDDKAEGFTPRFLVGCIGTTNLGGFDDLKSLGEIASEEKMWLHLDAAYGGSFKILPEFEHYFNGIEACTSINVNSSKTLMTGFDSSNMWIKDKSVLIDQLAQKASFMNYAHSELNFKDWQIPLGRDCKALKLWFVIQHFGVSGLQEYLRKHVEAGKLVEDWVKRDNRLELVVRRHFGLVCFRVKGENWKTEALLEKISQDQNLFLVGSKFDGKTFLRLSPANPTYDLSSVEETISTINSYLE